MKKSNCGTCVYFDREVTEKNTCLNYRQKYNQKAFNIFILIVLFLSWACAITFSFISCDVQTRYIHDPDSATELLQVDSATELLQVDSATELLQVDSATDPECIIDDGLQNDIRSSFLMIIENAANTDANGIVLRCSAGSEMESLLQTGNYSEPVRISCTLEKQCADPEQCQCAISMEW